MGSAYAADKIGFAGKGSGGKLRLIVRERRVDGKQILSWGTPLVETLQSDNIADLRKGLLISSTVPCLEFHESPRICIPTAKLPPDRLDVLKNGIFERQLRRERIERNNGAVSGRRDRCRNKPLLILHGPKDLGKTRLAQGFKQCFHCFIKAGESNLARLSNNSI